eukprot:11193676-Lingulodinium_polyedra.AAC.1
MASRVSRSSESPVWPPDTNSARLTSRNSRVWEMAPPAPRVRYRTAARKCAVNAPGYFALKARSIATFLNFSCSSRPAPGGTR